MSEGNMVGASQSQGSITPSKVLHVKNLAPATEANDLRQIVSNFGNVLFVVMLPKHQQALIEMGNETQASAVIQFAQHNPVIIKNRNVIFNFSKSKEIKRPAILYTSSQQNATEPPHQGEQIILLTVINPLYSIDVNVLHTILRPFGNILRIVVFHKNGTQALAEFDDAASAAQAKQALDGKDIYDGCCTLRVTFSRVEQLNVKYNTDKTRDFTNPNLPTQAPSNDPPYALMQTPYSQPLLGLTSPQIITTVHPSAVGSVLIAHNFPLEKLTCDRVFNLFCLYGNIGRIKLLASKEGSAMIQMFDKLQADQALSNLNGLVLESSQELSIIYSKHPNIADSNPVIVDPNGDCDSTNTNPSCKDYTSSPCNRFTRQNIMTYKHFYPPSNVLYFSNASPTSTESTIKELFSNLTSSSSSSSSSSSNKPLTPTAIKFFQTSSPKKTGLIEFKTIEDASMAVFMSNNQRIEGHTIHLSFSLNKVN